MNKGDYRSGLDRLLDEEFHRIQGKTVGIVTNHTGVNSEMRLNFEVLATRSDVQVKALFAPEHGVRGNVPAGDIVGDERDPATGIRVYSLYGKQRTPSKDMLAGLDIVIYDLQDVGVRYYTYLSTMFEVMKACAERGIPFLVLDRLNPLGRRVEGNILEPGFQSFVGAYPMALRHGMTVGELAGWANETFEIGADLEVIKCSGWNGQYFDELGLPWIPPSPNISSFVTALVYPITCLFEGTNISEGRGTANPFEYVGAPWIDPLELVRELEQTMLTGVMFRPAYFKPTTSKHAGKECGGVQVIVSDRERIDSCLTGLTLLSTIRALYPEETTWWHVPGMAFPFGIDRLMGTDKVRQGLEQGQEPKELIRNWAEESKEYRQACTPYLLY